MNSKKLLKALCIFGLICLILSQVLLSRGTEFLQAQKPIDFTHWLMLIGALSLLPVSLFFPKNIFNTIATPLTVLGIGAIAGMSAIDFILWSYGTDYESRDALIIHLMSTPAIWFPFFVFGPALFYAGLSTQAWYFIRSHTLQAIITLVGSSLIGWAQFSGANRVFIILGTTLFALGLALLLYRKEK